MRRLSVVLAVVFAVLLGSGVTARASDPDDERQWIGTQECVTGALTGVARDTDPHLVVVQGWAALCDKPSSWDSRAEFGVANFYTAGGTLMDAADLRPYSDEPTTPRQVATAALANAQFGSCLMSSFTHRVACAEVTVSESGQVSFRPIAVDDPLVGGPVEGLTVGRWRPECGSCF
jgi:hypothetical protein